MPNIQAHGHVLEKLQTYLGCSEAQLGFGSTYTTAEDFV